MKRIFNNTNLWCELIFTKWDLPVICKTCDVCTVTKWGIIHNFLALRLNKKTKVNVKASEAPTGMAKELNSDQNQPVPCGYICTSHFPNRSSDDKNITSFITRKCCRVNEGKKNGGNLASSLPLPSIHHVRFLPCVLLSARPLWKRGDLWLNRKQRPLDLSLVL